MGASMLQDSYEMREFHRTLLQRNRLYLLHNIRPCETFWSSLLAKDILSQNMIDEIKASRTTNDQLGRLLDILPTRGPTAFEEFCIALLESDHPHVAEYMKTIEATDQFRRDIQPYCQDAPEHLLDRYVAVFKRSAPSVMRFAEKKFEMILNETTADLRNKENEIRELENKNTSLEMGLSQLRTILKSCAEMTENIANEVQREFLSKSFLSEQFEHLEKFKTTLQGTKGFEHIITVLSNIQTVLRCLERHTGVRLTDRNLTTSTHILTAPTARLAGNAGPGGGRPRSPVASDDAAGHRMQWLADTIAAFVDEIGSKQTVSGLVVRVEMEKMMRTVREVHNDVVRIRDAFRTTLKQKQKLEVESLSLLHCYQEIRRLEREIKEKVSHIGDLTRQSQLMRKKVTTNPRQQRRAVEQIAEDIDRRRRQMAELEDDLRRQMDSAERRINAMLNLLPDRDDHRPTVAEASLVRSGNIPVPTHPGRSDTDITASTASRPVSPAAPAVATASSPSIKRRDLVGRDNEDFDESGDVKDTARSTTVDVENSMTMVTGGRKLLERRRSRQQVTYAGGGSNSSSNLNTKRVAATRNMTRTGGEPQRNGNAAAMMTSARHAVAMRQSTDGRQSPVVGHQIVGHDTVEKATDGSKRIADVAVVRHVDGAKRHQPPVASSTTKATRHGGGNDSDDDGEDSVDDEEEEDSDEDATSDADSVSRRGSPPKIKSELHRADFKKKTTVPNKRPQQQQQRQQQPKTSTSSGVVSEAGNGRAMKQQVAPEVAASGALNRDDVVCQTKASVSSSKPSTSTPTSSPEGGSAVGGTPGDKRSPQNQQSSQGVANITALLTSSLGGVSSGIGVGGGGTVAASGIDFLAGKSKPVTMRQAMTTNRVELSLRFPPE